MVTTYQRLVLEVFATSKTYGIPRDTEDIISFALVEVHPWDVFACDGKVVLQILGHHGATVQVVYECSTRAVP
jgi:hypothetical protein